MSNSAAAPQEVIDYWLEIGPKKWWMKDDAVDTQIREKFGNTYELAINGELAEWQNAPDSCLALVLVLDQFSRNLNRNSAAAFAHDDKALTAAKAAVAKGFPDQVNKELYLFFYLPYMHCERMEEQNECVRLMQMTDSQPSIDAALEHREIIERFGRFPHRNPVLGRKTTPEEQAFLDGGGFKG